jgi:hopanoid biosynthesis associated protein HpnK
MKRLIVNADDFGLTLGVNRAIAECYQHGIVTSATLMATGARFAEAVSLAAQMPALGVGCHIVLVDGEPVLPPSEVRSLLEPGTGRFYHGIGDVVRALVRRQFKAEEIEAEAGAQLSRLQSAGVPISHFDSHKHTHMFPPILKPLLRAAAAHGIRAVRNAFEAPGVLQLREACANSGLLLRKTGLGVLRASLYRPWSEAVNQAGFATPDGCVGMASTGSLTAEALQSILQRMPEGTWELVSHPGYNDRELDGVRTRLRASRDVERNALMDITRERLCEEFGVELVNFTALRQAQRTATERRPS